MALINLKKRLVKKEALDTSPQLLDKQEQIRIATCVILLEVAKSDDEFSSIEKTTIEAILKKDFRISEEAIEDLMEIAQTKREESIDLWEFTHLINENYSKQEKKKIVEEAWKVVYADNKLDSYEDHLVHKLARLLGLDHSDLIEAKLKIKYKNQG